ncbi:MAG TPA: LuxR C-terminal-related transcriptional regulator [Chloroflexia bacterium]|jgi:LuxR family maltose regulon positive regulatory protein
MARNTPRVVDGLLCYSAEASECVQVGSPEWWQWLEGSRVFRFEEGDGSFTARKEQRANGWYWYAYKRRLGKLRCVYMGPSSDLTIERLSGVARTMMDGEGAVTNAEPPHPVYSNPLLLTKLRPPVLRRKLVSRPALTRRLEEGLGGKLTLISAPAGSGKTTLLVEWAGHTELPVAWLSLDAGDNDQGRFLAYLIAALQGIRPDIGEAALPILRAPQIVPTEPAMTVLANSIASVPHDFILVLDDYHLIQAEAVHSAMTFLLDHAPPQMHLVIAGRTDPPLPLARLRAHGQLTELRASDLGFTSEETARFLREVMELPASMEEIAALERRTEGWIAGLQLAALSSQGRQGGLAAISTFTGSHRHLLDYLAAEVLEQQPPEVQGFLLRTSILDNLTAPLCEMVVEGTVDYGPWTRYAEGSGPGSSSGVQAMLERLERANLFVVALDERQEWYRYHPLFAEFLRSYLDRSMPGEAERLHLRAARWLQERGFVAEAILHALAAREYALAASLVEQLAQTMLTYGENTTLIGWLNALPEEVLLARPRLCICHAWAATYTGQLQVAEDRVNYAERAAATGVGGLESQELRGEIAAIRARLAAGGNNLERVLELSREALQHLPSQRLDLRGHVALNLGLTYMDFGEMEQTARYLSEAYEIGRASGNLRLAIFGLRYLGVARMVQGMLHEAARLYRQALQVAAEGQTSTRPELPAAGVAYAGLGRLLYEWNYLDEAKEHALRGIELGKRGGERKILLEGYTVLGKTLNALGDTEGAFEAMDRMVEIGGGTDWGHRARLWLAHGRVREAVRWMQELGLSKEVKPFYSDELEHLTAARVMVALGNTDDALYLLDRLLTAAEAQGRMRSVIEALTIQATAFQAQGRSDRARHSLERALFLAAPERFVRIIVDEGSPIVERLEAIYSERHARSRAGTHIPEDYLHALLSAVGRTPDDVPGNGRYSRPQANLLPEPLTPREMAVLRLISAGMSNGQIADELVVAVGTVKTHALGIYGKLNARNRTQAVARARELGLI